VLDTSLIRSSEKPNTDVAKYAMSPYNDMATFAMSQIDLWRGNYTTSLIDDMSPNIITWHNATSLIYVRTHFATSPTLMTWHFSHVEIDAMSPQIVTWQLSHITILVTWQSRHVTISSDAA
jgi:hypothetical protein